MSLDAELLVPIEETVDSDPTETTYLSNEKSDTSLVLPSTEDNSNSLIETEEFLDFVDDLSQGPSPFLDKEGTCQSDTALSNEHEETCTHWSRKVNQKLLLLIVKVVQLKLMSLFQKVIQLSLQTFLLLKVN